MKRTSQHIPPERLSLYFANKVIPYFNQYVWDSTRFAEPRNGIVVIIGHTVWFIQTNDRVGCFDAEVMGEPRGQIVVAIEQEPDVPRSIDPVKSWGEAVDGDQNGRHGSSLSLVEGVSDGITERVPDLGYTSLSLSARNACIARNRSSC